MTQISSKSLLKKNSDNLSRVKPLVMIIDEQNDDGLLAEEKDDVDENIEESYDVCKHESNSQELEQFLDRETPYIKGIQDIF